MTAQMPDKIRWNGRSYDLCTLPLEILFLAQGRRPAFEMIHTANYRGYWAHWRLPRGKLVLGGLEPNFAEDRRPIDYDDPEPISEMMTKLREQHDGTVKLLNELAAIQDRDRIVPPETIEISEENGFVEDDSGARIELEALLRAKEQPVFASWYSGLLRLQEGKPVRDWHSNFLTDYTARDHHRNSQRHCPAAVDHRQRPSGKRAGGCNVVAARLPTAPCS